jgi:hypothetical protein
VPPVGAARIVAAGSIVDAALSRERADMTKQTMIATAVSIFAASSFVAASASAQVPVLR